MYLYISGKYSGNCFQHYLLKYLKCKNILPNKTDFKRGFMPSKEKPKIIHMFTEFLLMCRDLST